MAHTAREFAQKLNKCLDESDAPTPVRERANILSKLLDIPKPQAWSILEGQLLPEHSILQRIAVEFEVDVKWLCDK
tara:strand:- start:691 stop:918 length:228 start_codon:yes stop_codon:yes gene_type:complete